MSRTAREPPDADSPLTDSLSMTVKTAIKRTELSKDALYDLIRDGAIKSFLMGTRRYILVESLIEYLRRRAAEPPTIRPSPNKRTAQNGLQREQRTCHSGKPVVIPKT